LRQQYKIKLLCEETKHINSISQLKSSAAAAAKTRKVKAFFDKVTLAKPYP
jgi:hypothetical protein